MIARIWFGKTRPEDADVYLDYLRRTGVAAFRSTPGNQGSMVLRRVGEHADFVVVSFWESEDAIRRFAGEEIDRAVYYPEDERYLLEMTETLDHYEVAIGASPSLRNSSAFPTRS